MKMYCAPSWSAILNRGLCLFVFFPFSCYSFLNGNHMQPKDDFVIFLWRSVFIFSEWERAELSFNYFTRKCRSYLKIELCPLWPNWMYNKQAILACRISQPLMPCVSFPFDANWRSWLETADAVDSCFVWKFSVYSVLRNTYVNL